MSNDFALGIIIGGGGTAVSTGLEILDSLPLNPSEGDEALVHGSVSDWTTPSGIYPHQTMNGVAYGLGQWVCVGVSGASYYSDDGLTWHPMSGLYTGAAYYDVAFGNDRFMCVGDARSVYYSTDGRNWVLTTGCAQKQDSVVYGNGQWICVGYNGSSYYSTDGAAWTAMTGLISTKEYEVVVYDGVGKWVTVGYGAGAYSTDGLTWTAMSTGLTTTVTYEGLAYGGGTWVATGSAGNRAYSTDGLTWTNSIPFTSGTYSNVTYFGTKFVTLSSSAHLGYYSTDGITWTQMTTAFSSQGMGQDGNKIISAGGHGRMAYSTDGMSFTNPSGLDAAVYNAIAFNGLDQWVCVGGSGVSYISSDDGVTWTAMTGLYNTTFYDVAYANGRWVTVGNSGKSYYSTDNATWTAMTGLYVTNYNAVLYAQGKWVCAGSSRAYYSTDGLTWTAGTGATGNISELVYGSDRFVGVGTSGAAFYSTDGITWTAMSNLPSNIGGVQNYRGLAYGSGIYVCMSSGYPYKCEDGVNWSLVDGEIAVGAMDAAAYCNGTFVVVGASGRGYSTYKDVLMWRSIYGLLATAIYNDIAYGNGKFMLAPYGGTAAYCIPKIKSFVFHNGEWR